MTSSGAPTPRASPRTNVVLPAPISPWSSRRSPRLRCTARRSAAASVASGDPVDTSREVVVATLTHRDLAPVRAHHHDPAVAREPAHLPEALRQRRPAADELHLLAAGERPFGTRFSSPRDGVEPQPGPHAGRCRELVQLPDEAIADVAAAETGRRQLRAQAQPRPRPAPRHGGTAQGPRDPDGPPRSGG